MADYSIMIRDLPEDQRPRERLAAHGPQALSAAELLALLLRSGTAKESVIRLAERLLAQFGSLKGIAGATLNELAQVKGIGPAKAAEVIAAVELGKRLATFVDTPRPVIRCPEDIANLVAPEMRYLRQEQFRVLMLDTRNQVLQNRVATQGSLNSSIVDCREVFREAIGANCAAVAVCHNHPSGDPSPSPEDLTVTKRLVEAGKLVGIEVVDHLIIGDGRWVSLRERGHI
jgi:DNA repair protein RadC